MKRCLVCLIVLFLCSCGSLWEVSPSYEWIWVYKNTTNVDLVIYLECKGLNEKGEESRAYTQNSLPKGEELWNLFETSDREVLTFYTHFLCLAESNTCMVWLANSEGDVLKLWEFGSDNGEHDLFDNSNWQCEDLGAGVDDNNVPYRLKWTFTITDADIGLEE